MLTAIPPAALVYSLGCEVELLNTVKDELDEDRRKQVSEQDA